jgi:dTDP-4-amino-4,6-dideoxygalactose transaminase
VTVDQVRLRHIAPAGAPIRLPDLARWAGLAISGRDVSGSLQQAFCERFEVRHSFLTSTGRAGMTVLLRALRRLAPAARNEVVLPSYTCFSVAASVVKAGLRPRIADISPETLDYTQDALQNTDFTRVLAVIATNLYGLPNDLPSIVDTARRGGAFVVDDAAQAMGASINGRWSGTWGDAGLYSFDKGKNVSAIDGGVVVTSSDAVASALREEMAGLPSPHVTHSAVGVAKALGYFLMLRPWLYWIPNAIPQLELGKTVYTTEFPLERPSRPLVALGRTMLGHLEDFTRARLSNAAALIEQLAGRPGIQTIAPAAAASPVYLRLPILVTDAAARQRAIQALNAAGIGASGSYPASLADIPDLDGRFAGGAVTATGGRYVARHIVTLPTHTFVSGADVDRASRALTTALSV